MCLEWSFIAFSPEDFRVTRMVAHAPAPGGLGAGAFCEVIVERPVGRWFDAIASLVATPDELGYLAAVERQRRAGATDDG